MTFVFDVRNLYETFELNIGKHDKEPKRLMLRDLPTNTGTDRKLVLCVLPTILFTHWHLEVS